MDCAAQYIIHTKLVCLTATANTEAKTSIIQVETQDLLEEKEGEDGNEEVLSWL